MQLRHYVMRVMIMRRCQLPACGIASLFCPFDALMMPGALSLCCSVHRLLHPWWVHGTLLQPCVAVRLVSMQLHVYFHSCSSTSAQC